MTDSTEPPDAAARDAGAPPKLRHMPALDGLRGLAVGGVLAFHSGVLRGGFLGVDLFFVLSGFLITSLLLREREGGPIRLARFWARRARRLLPAVLLVLLAVSLYAQLLAAPTELARIRGEGIATLAYVANWYALTAEHSYWALSSSPSPLAHSWSLAVEEQFYLLWPLAVALATRAAARARERVLVLSLVGAAAAALWMAWLHLPGADTSRAYFGTDTRASGLLFGSALGSAIALGGHPRSAAARRGTRLAAGAALLALGVAWYLATGQGSFLYRGGFALCQLAVALVLLDVSHPEPGPLARALSFGPLCWLGRISYGLYLWHWPVFVALGEARIGLGGAGLAALRLGLSLALAAGSYYAVEQPLRHGAFRGRRMAAVAAAAFVAVAGALFASTDGATADRPPARAWLRPDESAQSRADPFRLLVAGDSVAERLATYMAPLSSPLGVELASGAWPGCGLLGKRRLKLPDGSIRTRGHGCGDLGERWQALAHRHRAEVALLVVAPPVMGTWEVDGRWLHACEPGLDQLFESRAARAVDALGAHGAAVFVATMPYIVDDGYGDREDRATDCLNQALRRVAGARPFAATLELGAYVCPPSGCRARVDGVLLRHDGLHFQLEGAELVGWWLVGEIRHAGWRKLRGHHPAR